jgi:signal transduction histidine kinase/CheY-like chemotaxis protein
MYPWVPITTLALASLAFLALTHWFLIRSTLAKGLGWKSVATTVALVFVALALSRYEAKEASSDVQHIVEGMAPTYALGMRDRGIDTITVDTPPDDPTYLHLIRAQTEWLAANPSIADVYVMGKRADGQIVLLVDSETDYDHSGLFDDEREQRTAIGEPYDEDGESLERAFAGENVFQSEAVQDRWGSWISSYVPIRSTAGTVIGVLGVDFPSNRWDNAIIRAVWSEIAKIGVSIVVVIAWGACFSMWRSAIARERDESRKAAAAQADAEAKSHAKGEFLAHMTHELRTPMTAIHGHVELLGDSGLSSAEREASLRTIRSQCDHLMALVGDVLDLSKAEAGHMTIEPGECPIIEVGQNVVDALHLRAQEKQISIAMTVEYPVPASLPWNPTRIRQIILNLMGNAVKFTHKGGVTLRVAFDRSTSSLTLEVIDTGIGMTPEQAARLFNPYVQATTSTSSKYGGTGLGLVISKQLVELIGGTLVVTSREGEGTRLTMVVPVPAENLMLIDGPTTTRDEPVRTAPIAPATPRLRGRILLAEDSPDIQRLMEFILTKAGALITTCIDGIVTLNSIKQAAAQGSPFDLVLLDMDLPNMNGLDIIRTLRADGYTGKVCALTARSMAGDREACLHAGCDDYMTKPIDRTSLVIRCAALLNPPASKAA